MNLQHALGCPGPLVSVVAAVTFTQVTCRGCHAETRVPR